MSSIPPTVPPPPGGGSYVPPPPPPPSGAGGSSDRTLFLILSYVWLLSLIPLFVKKDDREIQWHAKNGLVMAIVYTAIQIIISIAAHMSSAFACLTMLIPCLLFIAYAVVQVVCIVKAVNGQRMRIPMLTDFAEKM